GAKGIHDMDALLAQAIQLEVETQLHRLAPWRHEVRSAERRQEVVERFLVRQVDHRESQAPLVAIAAEQVVVADADIEQMSWRDAWRILVVVLGTVGRNLDSRRAVRSAGRASSQWRADRCERVPAK